MKVYQTTEEITPLSNIILVHNMEKGEKISRGGIIITDDNGTDRGIKPRWAQVYNVGKNINNVAVGEWILIEHGRWTYGINKLEIDESGNEVTRYIQRIEPSSIILISDECPV